jgi:hypothetical protein
MGDEWGRPRLQDIDHLDDERDMAVMRGDWKDEEDVKDEWDAEDEKVTLPPPPPPPVAPIKSAPKKTTIPPVIMENETEQEKKARLEKLVRERDLDSAMTLFGISGKSPTTGEACMTSSTRTAERTSENTIVIQSLFDSMNPTTVAEFDSFTRVITKRLESLEVTFAIFPLLLIVHPLVQ